MPDVPFGSTTWTKRSNIPGIILNGTYSGPVQGPRHAVYDKESRVIQSFSRIAHHFNGFVNTAQASTDDGTSWTTTFNHASDINLNEVAFQGWATPHPGFFGRLHFQVRWAWAKASLIADGSIVKPGGVALYVGTDGVNYSKHQDLHTWPQHNAAPSGTGGPALLTTPPSCTQPLLLEGSGPDGEDAYWMASSFQFSAGGTGNPQTFKASTLWRSDEDGIFWEPVRNLEPVFGGVIAMLGMFRSTTGRLFISALGRTVFTDDVDDLESAVFTISNGLGSLIHGPIVQMYGGTLLTHGQGSLIAAGTVRVSCDDGLNFQDTNVQVAPVNQTGFLAKLGPTEALIIAPGFSNPSTETVSHYSDDGGETFQDSDPWLVSTVGESPVMIALRSNGTPIVVSRSTGGVYTSADTARGVAGQRTICPLANAGLAAARPLLLCGNALANDSCTDD